jgi:hypothetical protein
MKAKLTREPLPPTWDESPKGCWATHPLTRTICQLPIGDGHDLHKQKHPNGQEIECWQYPKIVCPKPVSRWALWSRDLKKFYCPLPHQTEILFDSRRAAMASVHSGNYGYRPVRVKLVPQLPGGETC